MSFSNKCKEEILETDFSDKNIAEALIYGLFSFSSGVNTDEILITSENISLLETAAFCMVSIGIDESYIEIIPGIKTYTLSVTSRDKTELLLDRFDLMLSSGTYELNDSIVYTPETRKAYIIGAFLGSGTILSPSKGYHLQFSTQHSERAQTLYNLLHEEGFEAKFSRNAYNWIIYFKNSSMIEDLLTYMGAMSCSMEVMELKVYKEVKNTVTRRVNCESANLQKTIASASDDVEMFRAFLSSGGGKKLKKDQLALAKLRINHPEFSFTELADQLGDDITKSGVNHRLRKLREIIRENNNHDDNQ